ncbi:MAG: hypothetical protein F6K42_00335 [Leptolyngbya sp. SIO1D8]|nr:hypothetical protein [Leptolyngbya sp. SIO1D8]
MIFTEKEWGKTTSPAFELHPKLGIFCRGVQVLGYELEPVTATATMPTATAVEAQR